MGIKPEINDEYYMRLAIEQAHQAELEGEVPVGAVVVYKQNVIAEAHNQVIQLNNPCAHAEMTALKLAGEFIGNYRLVDCELYVTLEPCGMCAGAMIHARLKRLVFGAYDLKTGVASSVEQHFQKPFHNHNITITAGVLDIECGELLSAFFKKRRIAKKSRHCE
jgi:tRNA(adenine34) deaminase